MCPYGLIYYFSPIHLSFSLCQFVLAGEHNAGKQTEKRMRLKRVRNIPCDKSFCIFRTCQVVCWIFNFYQLTMQCIKKKCSSLSCTAQIKRHWKAWAAGLRSVTLSVNILAPLKFWAYWWRQVKKSWSLVAQDCLTKKQILWNLHHPKKSCHGCYSCYMDHTSTYTHPT